MIFLIHYDRERALLVSMRSFDDSSRDEASRLKLELEISLLGNARGMEVVLLEADSEEDLRKTHSRYFETLAELKSSEGRKK